MYHPWSSLTDGGFYDGDEFVTMRYSFAICLLTLCSCNYAPCDAGLFGGGFINIVNVYAPFSDGVPGCRLNLTTFYFYWLLGLNL